jgi:tetratricopeptide (TPR) repeat protein
LLIGAYDDVRLWDRAISHAREYVALYPDAGNATIMRTRIGRFLYDMKEYDRAISYLKELKQRVDATTETEIQYWIAKSYADRGNLETAISEFLKVKYVCKPTKMPFGVTALYEAGQIYKKIGEFDKAKELFQVVVRERGAGDQIGNAAQKQIDEIDKEIAKDS